MNKVNHPNHYNGHPSGIECIDIVEDFNFNFGNAIKYLCRCGLKENTSKEEDIRKAKFYLDREFDRLKNATNGGVAKSNALTGIDLLNSF
jgi:hypothetical protein